MVNYSNKQIREIFHNYFYIDSTIKKNTFKIIVRILSNL